MAPCLRGPRNRVGLGRSRNDIEQLIRDVTRTRGVVVQMSRLRNVCHTRVPLDQNELYGINELSLLDSLLKSFQFDQLSIQFVRIASFGLGPKDLLTQGLLPLTKPVQLQ